MSWVAFLFHRQPGVKFWFFGPVWRANEYVTPTGAKLWAGGILVVFTGMAVGFALMWTHVQFSNSTVSRKALAAGSSEPQDINCALLRIKACSGFTPR